MRCCSNRVKRCVLLGIIAIAGCRINFDPTTDDGGMGSGSDDADVCTTAWICDDFNVGIPAPVGTAQHDPSGGREGTGALRSEAGPGQVAYVRYTLSPPVTTGTLYVRTHIKVAAGTPIQNFAVLLQLDNGVETNGFEKVSADISTNDRFAVEVPFVGESAVTTTAVARDQWVCLELAITVDETTTGNIELSIAGEKLYSSGPLVTMPPGGFARVILGLSLSNSESTTLVWFDDFVMADAVGGC